MAIDNELKIKVQVNNQKANKSFKETEKTIKDVEKQTKSTEAGMERMRIATSGLRRSIGALRNNFLLVSFALGGVGAALGKTVKLFGQQELAEKKLETALGKTSQALLDQASALQSVTTFGDENIIQAQALIAAFTDDEEAIKRATEATLDLAAAKGMDLFAAADLVAKTLGSTTNAMSRYGIEVTGAVGSTERLDTLTQNIANTFGGQAKAQAETLTGSLEQMGNSVGDAAEAVGSLLAPAVVVTSGFIKSMADELGRLINAHDNLVKISRQTGEVLTSEEAAVASLSGEIENMTRSDIINRLSAMFDGMSVKTIEDELPKLQKMFHDLEKGTFQLDTSIALVNSDLSHQFELIKMLVGAYEFAPDAITPYDEKLQEFITTQLTTLSNYEQEQQLLADFIEKYPKQAEALGLVTDATKAQIEATKLSIDMDKKKLKSQSTLFKGAAALASQFSGAAKAAARMQQTAAVIDTWASATAALAPPPKGYGPVVGPVMATGIVASGLAQVMQISKSIGEFKHAATGADFITNGPQMMMVGDNPSGQERVQVTPLGGDPNVHGPQGGGGSITVNIQGNLLSEEYVETELAEKISTAVRRGVDFGIS